MKNIFLSNNKTQNKNSTILLYFLILINLLYTFNFTTVSVSNKSFSFNLRSLTMEKKTPIFGKAYYILNREIDTNKNYHLNNLEKMIFEITNTDIFLFRNHDDNDKITMAQLKHNFFQGIKLGDIDLICGDYLFLCTYGQFKREYKNKLRKYNLDLNLNMENTMIKLLDNKENIETNCLILTTGAFLSINNLPFLCFEKLDEMISIQNILSERILRENIIRYQGATGMLNEKGNGFINGILNIINDKILFSYIKKNKGKTTQKYFTETLKIKLTAVHFYATTVYNNKEMPWKGDVLYNPDPTKCFKISYDVNSNTDSTKFVPYKKVVLKDLFFCSFYNRNDILMKNKLSNEMSAFINSILVARINLKLHTHNLEIAHKKIKEFTGKKLTCINQIVEPIKYEIRLKYLISRHKIAQLINLKRIPKEKGIDLIQKSKDKIIKSSCKMNSICIKSMTVCVNDGLLPLKVKGFKFATSLQNPYISTLDLKGISYRDKPRSKIGEELMKKTKSLLLSKRQRNNLFFHEINHEVPEVPLLKDINRAFNSFKFYFKGIKNDLINVQQMNRHCRWISRGSLSHLNKKLFYSSFALENEPFMDYLTTIKGNNMLNR